MTATEKTLFRQASELSLIDEPVKAALVGAGERTRRQYLPLFESMGKWIEVCAICDPVKEHAEEVARSLKIPAYHDIHELVKDGAAEAAIVVTPPASHHSISVYLSSHGIHNLIETPWATMVCQGREMLETARKHKVVTRVAENFFRFPIDRFAQLLKESGYIGPMRRIFSYNDHTGYHNNSRWIRFARAHPQWVEAITHSISTPGHRTTRERFHTRETFRGRYFMFPGNLLVVDQTANEKNRLGRQPRPGYTEWHGDRGTLIHRGINQKLGSETRICRCSDAGIDEFNGMAVINPVPDQIIPVVHETAERGWLGSYAETPEGRLEYVNQLRPQKRSEHVLIEYGTPLMGHMVDFALAVRDAQRSEFDDDDALMALMMDAGADESALNEGKRVKLPLEDDLVSDAMEWEAQRSQYGVDPLDIEAMLAVSYPKP